MSLELLEKILNLFETFQIHQKPLQINIDEDLSKIFPLPKKIILDLISDDEVFSKLFLLSNDGNLIYYQDNLHLCATDQNEGGSCSSSSCEELHICMDYLLSSNCSQFNRYGKCLHSHSLSTKHNKTIIEKLNLLLDNEATFELIARLIKISLSIANKSHLILQTLNEQYITDQLIDLWLNDHKSLLLNKKVIDRNSVQLTFNDDEIASMMENYIMQNYAETVSIKKKLSLDEISSLYNSKVDVKSLNKQSNVMLTDNLFALNSCGDRNSEDLENENTNMSANRQISRDFDQPSEANEKHSYINKISRGYFKRLSCGRGRGKEYLNNTPPSPSLSKEKFSDAFHSQSSEYNMKIDDEYLLANISDANDRLSPIDSSSTKEKNIAFSQRLKLVKNENESLDNKSKPTDNNINPKLERNENKHNFISNTSSPHHKSQSQSDNSSNFEQQQNNRCKINNNNDYLVNDDLSETDRCENTLSACQDIDSKTRFILRARDSNNKAKSLTQCKSQTSMKYIYKKQFSDQNLCYLLGPGKKYIDENDQCQILPFLTSGYCQLTNIGQGKDIEKQLYSILPATLNIDKVKINHRYALLVCSSAAEYIFQQSQTHYAIITEPCQMILNIDIISATAIEQEKSPLTSNSDTASSSTKKEHNQRFSSDEKFHISTTNSSIAVISGDISQVPVDMMICVSTSNNLRDSILRSAGHQIESEYKRRYHPTDALLLNGGLTAARKILFVPWQTEVEQRETAKIQKSLSDLVKWSIEQAHQRKMKSISFPPIGTGQLGLDPAFVCEEMTNAAHECLHKYEMNVSFVIYPSTRLHNNHPDECYQVFKVYLDSLSEAVQSMKLSTSTINNQGKISSNFNSETQTIQRDIQSKRVLTLSNSTNVIEHHNLLMKSLDNLIYEKIFDLSLIESSLIDKIDLLIDICLQYNVYPHVDFARKQLKLSGDKDSCFQCIFNIRNDKKVHQYSYLNTRDDEKSSEIKLNSFVSLKIDEAFAVNESNICVSDDDQESFHIDLNNLKIKINPSKHSTCLIKRQINYDTKARVPSSWSSSLLMIRKVEIKKSSYELLQCFQMFYQTMPVKDWEIERIDSIENYPLYVHSMNNKKPESKLYFHGCSYSSVQSIIHYGLHSTNASNYGDQFNNNRSNGSICLTRDVLNSHLYGTRRSTDGKHYLFVVEIAKTDTDADYILLTNEDTYLALPTYLIVYQRRANV